MTSFSGVIAAALERRRQQLDGATNSEADGRGSPPAGNSHFEGPTVDDSNIDPDLLNQGSASTSTLGRRQRANSESETPEERGRKHARFVEGVCNQFGLAGGRRTIVQDFSKLTTAQRDIFMMASWQSNASDAAESACKVYLGSERFKDHGYLLLQTLILSPSIRSYVAGVGTFCVTEIVRNFDLWKIPKSVVDDPVQRGAIISAFRTKLTAIRNAIKDILELADQNAHCINRLMNSLFPDTVEVTEAHRARWAWVFKQYQAHKTAVAETAAGPDNAKVKDSAFWKNLDKVLSQTEAELAVEVPDKLERQIVRNLMFEDELSAHRATYSSQVAQREVPSVPQWQITLEHSVERYHGF